MDFILGLFIGALVGVCGLAIFGGRRDDYSGADECEACKAAMCEDCIAAIEYATARADWEKIWEELQHCKRELQACKRSKAQVSGAHSRALHELWASNNKPSMGG